MSRRDAAGKTLHSEDGLHSDVEVYLSEKEVENLRRITACRERVQLSMSSLDVEIYDLETEFLKQSVSYGGSLFDGFGLERQSNAHRGAMAVLTPIAASPSSAFTGVAGVESSSGAAAASPSLLSSGGAVGSSNGSNTSVTTHTRTYHSPPTPVITADGVRGATSSCPITYQVGSKGTTSPAYHYRLNFFSPSERVFSACSVGALSRVELAKTLGRRRMSVAASASLPLSRTLDSSGKRSRQDAFSRSDEGRTTYRRRRGDAES